MNVEIGTEEAAQFPQREYINGIFVEVRNYGCIGLEYVLYSTLLHLPPLRFHSVGGRWD
jgi:hypothetical protein